MKDFQNSSVLMQAYRLSEKVAAEGFDYDSALSALAKVEEEVQEVKDELLKSQISQQALLEELGDLAFSFITLARHCCVNPEDTIQYAMDKFSRRYQKVKAYTLHHGINLDKRSVQEINEIWDKVKNGAVGED